MKSGTKKVALVTGGASGIGRSITERLLGDGFYVVIGDINQEAALAAAKQLDCDHVLLDVTDEDAWTRVMGRLESTYGGLDILVNNAGILGDSVNVSPEEATLESWRRVIHVNLDSVFLGCRAAIRVMRRTDRGGSIVNIASVASELATPFATAYGASKAGVAHLTKSVAQYCAQEGLGIRCNSIHPGNVHTAMHDARANEIASARGVDAEAILSRVGQSPLGGWVPASQIAAAVSYLVSDSAGYVTGVKLPVDGGTLGCDTFDTAAQATKIISPQGGERP